MYTRNQGITQPTSAIRGAAVFGTDGTPGNRRETSGGAPLLIPQDYRGELLRGHPTTPFDDMGAETERFPAEPPVLSEVTEVGDTASDETGRIASDALTPKNTAVSDEHSTSNHSLFGGLYDLLLGDNSSEEETLILLGIGLLLLWGHLDRGGLFDRSTWDTDDLALLLIGYLLLS